MRHQKCPHCDIGQDVSAYAPNEKTQCACCGSTFRVEEPLPAMASFRAKANAPESHAEPAGQQTPSPQYQELAQQYTASPQHTPPFQQEGYGPLRRIIEFHKRKPKEDTPSPERAAKQPNNKKKSNQLSIKGYDIDTQNCLGKGGMGQVYMAIQKSLGRNVAIKTLDSVLARNQASILRFAKEAAAMARLHHPNIVHIIDRGVSNRQHYFIMEYVDGSSLRDHLHEGAFSPQDALRVMRDLAKTMEYAHAQGVIHRDLKPENLLFTFRGELKVADFGLAGVNETSTHIRNLTRSYVSMGTECYMAPEQRRDAKKVDHRADIYSMGVIFYELLTNNIPFPKAPSPDKAIVPGHPEIDKIVRKCLETHPDKRYDTTQQFTEAIQIALQRIVARNRQRDTVVDAPAIQEMASFTNRFNEFPEKLRSSISGARSNLSESWRFGHLQKAFWSGSALMGIALVVGIFFFLSPSPPVPGASKHEVHGQTWMKILAQEKPYTQAKGVNGTTLFFDFRPKNLKSSWGKRPRQQWKLLKGNWLTTGRNVLEQDTYRNGFTRNRRNCWALYKGHKLPKNSLLFSASIKMLSPFVKGENGSSKSLDSYLSRNIGKNYSRLKPTMGIGLRGNRSRRVSFTIQQKNNKMFYRLVVRDSRINPRQRTKVYSGVIKQALSHGRSYELGLLLNKGVLSAWFNEKKLKEIKLPQNELFRSNPGFICRDAHCRYKEIHLHTTAPL